MAFTFKQTPAVATKSNVPTIMSATQANAAKTPIPAVANTLPRAATPAATPTIYSAAQANKATTPVPTPTAAKPATDPFASYGGKDNYSANQNERYAQAYSSNDTALMGRLIADSQRAGYSLNTPKPANATPTAGQTTPYVAPTYNVLDYSTALGQAYGQLDPTYQQAVQAAQQQGYTNQLDAGELASARGGAHSGLAADLQNKVNINTQNEISKLAAERMAKAAEMAQQLVQRSQDNAYRDKTYDRGVYVDDRAYNYGVSRDAVADSRYTDETKYNRGRDALSDTRYTDETKYNRGRDLVADNRYNAETAYSHGRDALSDKRYDSETAYSRSRDTVADSRYADERNYSRSRDYLADSRYDDETSYNRGRDLLADDKWWIQTDYEMGKDSGASQAVSGATAGTMLKQSLQKVNGVDPDTGKTIYGEYSDPVTREKAFIDAWNTSGVEPGAETIEMLTKAGYSSSEINTLKQKYPQAFNTGSSAGGSATPVSTKVPQKYASLIETNNKKYGLPTGLLAAVADAESDFNPNASNKSGASGMFQFMPATAKGYGINPFDPVQAADAAGKMLSGLIAKYGGDVAKALAGYNWGGGNVDKAIKKYGDNWLAHAPAETKGYIQKILG